MDKVTLLPCPFCGEKNVKPFGPYGWYRQYGISHSCKSFYNGTSEMMQGFNSEAEAITAWNTRATPAPDSEKLREALEAVVQMITPAGNVWSGDEPAWQTAAYRIGQNALQEPAR